MADTGWLMGSSTTSVDTGGPEWGTTDNALTDNTAYAYVNDANVPSDRLYVYGFDFSSIPNGSTIDGIEVQIKRYSNSAGCDDTEVALGSNSATIESANYATYTDWPTTIATPTYGGATDTWSWTGITTNDLTLNFGVGFRANPTYASKFNYTAYVDYIFVKIHYTAPTSMAPLMMIPF